MAFGHEHEVRLLYFEPREHPHLFQYHLDPHTFVEEIVVDPRQATKQPS